MRFVKLSETITDWEWFTDGNMLKVWIWLLVNAQQFEDGRFRGVELKVGQLVAGRKQIAKETGLSEMQVRTCLKRLESTNEITIKTTNKFSLITILKYGKYQAGDEYGNQQKNQQNNQRITNKQPTNNHQITTSKRDKRERGKDINNIPVVEVVNGSPEFEEAFEALLEVRKAKKVPNTDRAIKQILNKLDTLAPNDEKKKIDLLNTAIERGWSTVFAPGTPKSVQKEKKGFEALMDL